ncbi:MAG: FAD-dependent oxidoreductase, partial [Sediminibacterium sp.]|nr:FAD-dependent oxidoreductase [Sediminibacterium sp.]
YNQIECKKMICCTGINSIQHTLFKKLPFSFSKGQAIIIASNLPRNYMYKNKMSIIPWQENQFWVGSNYQWNYNNDKPDIAFKENVIHFLTHFLKIPCTIKDHLAGIRPTNLNRRPFVGWHPTQPNIGILNGMGTKGCSLAPYFAKQFTNHILGNGGLNNEVDIKNLL